MFDLRDFYLGLTADEQARFCQLAETTDKYMRSHLVRRSRTPGVHKMNALVAAVVRFRPNVQRHDVVMWFYSEQESAA